MAERGEQGEQGPEFDAYTVGVGDVIEYDPASLTEDSQPQVHHVVIGFNRVIEAGQADFSAAQILSDEPGEENLGYPGSIYSGAVRKVAGEPWSIERILRGLSNHTGREDDGSLRKYLEYKLAKGAFPIPPSPPRRS